MYCDSFFSPVRGLWSNCVRETFPVCKRSATLTDHYVKCQLAFKLWLRQLSSKATLLHWITALCEVSSVRRMNGLHAAVGCNPLGPQQQCLIPRWNETSNCKPPIRIKIPVTLVDWGSELIRWLVITTAHDADTQSLFGSARCCALPFGDEKGCLMMKRLGEHT